MADDPAAPQRPFPVQRVRGSRLLAQAGVPMLLLSALLVVVGYDATPSPPPTTDLRGDAPPLGQDAVEAGRAALRELTAFAREHEGQPLEVYARARELTTSRVPEVAATAARLCEELLPRLDPDLKATLERGAALEAEGKDGEADAVYKAYLSRPDVTGEAARVVRDARGRASGRLQARFTTALARLRELVAAGERAQAEALVAEVGRDLGAEQAARARALLDAPVAPATSPTEDVPLDVGALARALRATAVEPAEGGAVRLRYRFDGEAAAHELVDWPEATQSFSGALQPADLASFAPQGRPAWFTAEGALVGEGFGRRFLVVDFRADRPLLLEALVRGAGCRAIGLGLLSGRGLLAVSGFALDPPLARLPNAPQSLADAVARCAERGPATALLREARWLDFAELAAVVEPPRAQVALALTLLPPAEPGGPHQALLQLGEQRLAAASVLLDEGPVRAFLVALGPAAAWDEVVVTGAPSADIARALPGLAAGDEPRARLLDWLRRRRPEVRIR